MAGPDTGRDHGVRRAGVLAGTGAGSAYGNAGELRRDGQQVIRYDTAGNAVGAYHGPRPVRPTPSGVPAPVPWTSASAHPEASFPNGTLMRPTVWRTSASGARSIAAGSGCRRSRLAGPDR